MREFKLRRIYCSCLLTLIVLAAPAWSLESDASQANLANGSGAGEIEGSDWLNEYLAAELNYTDEQIEKFKTSVAELDRQSLEQLVNRIKLQRERNSDESDINSPQREQSLRANQIDQEKLIAAKNRVVPLNSSPGFNDGYNYGYRRARRYRALFYRRAGRQIRFW